MKILVREIREARGWSLSELSRRTAISKCDLSLLEREMRPAFPGWQKRIARAFQLPISEVFRDE